MLASFVALCSLFVFNYCQTPLDDFIAANDGYYSWKPTGIHETGNNSAGEYDMYLINMTSQMWLNSTYVNRPIWWHYLWIIMPHPSTDIINTDYATIVIQGGDNNDTSINYNSKWIKTAQFIATSTKTIVGLVSNVPNEPLLFYNDPQQIYRHEGSLLAFAEYEFGQLYQINSNSSYKYQWVIEFAMTKAVIKAMDTVNAFIYQHSNHNVTRFGVSGGSKRGLTTWLTAAADDRIKLFMPVVMDMPNTHTSMHHMYKAYDGWTYAFSNYYVMNITKDTDSDWTYSWYNATDPLVFFDRYTDKPKLIIDGINDEYFMPDDSYYWYDQLGTVSNKFYQMIPNADHDEAGQNDVTAPTLASFIHVYLNDIKLPQLTWNIDNVTGMGNITVYYKGNTSMIFDSEIWYGRSCSNVRRDFRLYNLDNPCDCGVMVNNKCKNTQSVFVNKKLKPISQTENEAVWSVSSPDGIPTDHWVGFELAVYIKIFDTDIQLINDGITPLPTKFGELILTTQTSIVPQKFPFADCSGAGCYGVLV
eukprot:115333_1